MLDYQSYTGEYYLQEVREMASGFILQPDGTFQFFFTYGALDRMGTGKWTINDGKLILNSLSKPGSDFRLVESRKNPHDFIHIRLSHSNAMLLRHTWCSLEKGAEGTWKSFDQLGDLQFPAQDITSLALQFEFCPERFSVIPVTNNDHNDFVLRVEPWLTEVFFENFSLQVGEEGLSGRHPLLEGEKFKYSKQ